MADLATGSWIRGYGRVILATSVALSTAGCISSETNKFDPHAINKADARLQDLTSAGKPITAAEVKQAFLISGIKPSDRFMAALLIADSVFNQHKLPPAAFMQGLNAAIDVQFSTLPSFIQDAVKDPLEKNAKCFFSEDGITAETWQVYERVVATELNKPDSDFTNDRYDSKRLRITHDICYLVAKAATVTLVSDLSISLKLLPKVLEFGRDYSTMKSQIVFFVAEGSEKSADRVLTQDADMGLTRDQYITFGLASTIVGALDLRKEATDNDVFWQNFIQSPWFKADFSLPPNDPDKDLGGNFRINKSGNVVIYSDPEDPSKDCPCSFESMRTTVNNLTFATQALQQASLEFGPRITRVFADRARQDIPGFQFLEGYATAFDPNSAVVSQHTVPDGTVENKPAAKPASLIDSIYQFFQYGKKGQSK